MRVAVFLVLLAACSAHAQAVTIAWSPVGNPGNAADPASYLGNPAPQLGAVSYSYSIGTYDVTNSQYVEFLNAKDPTGADPLGLYNSGMTSGRIWRNRLQRREPCGQQIQCHFGRRKPPGELGFLV